MTKRWTAYAAVLATALLLAGCGGTSDEKTITLGLSYDSLESAWLVMNHQAVIEEAEKRGAKVISVMAEGDAADDASDVKER